MKRSTEEHFASHWLTIQPSLFDFLEDEVGELDDNQRLFVRIAESVELGRIARRYGWCGNGRKPSSRLAMFKMFVMKHVWNFTTTKDEKTAAAELAAIRAQVDANTEDCNALALQKERDLDTNLSLPPTLCGWGCKRNSKGKTQGAIGGSGKV